MEIKPLKGKLYVEALSDCKQTNSGIWLARSTQEVYHYGKVLAVGGAPQDKKGRTLPWPYEQGDIVHFKKYAFKKYRDEDFKVRLFLKKDEILAYERHNAIFAANDYTLVKMKYVDKLGSFYVPDNKKLYTAAFTGEVVSVGLECRLNIKECDNIYIMRIEGGGHEGFKVETDNGLLWAISPKWVYGKEERGVA